MNSAIKVRDDHSQESLKVKELIKGCNNLRGTLKERYKIKIKLKQQTNKIDKTYREALHSLNRDDSKEEMEKEFRDNLCLFRSVANRKKKL